MKVKSAAGERATRNETNLLAPAVGHPPGSRITARLKAKVVRGDVYARAPEERVPGLNGASPQKTMRSTRPRSLRELENEERARNTSGLRRQKGQKSLSGGGRWSTRSQKKHDEEASKAICYSRSSIIRVKIVHGTRTHARAPMGKNSPCSIGS